MDTRTWRKIQEAFFTALNAKDFWDPEDIRALFLLIQSELTNDACTEATAMFSKETSAALDRLRELEDRIARRRETAEVIPL